MKQLANNYSISGATVTLTGVNVPLAQILLVSNATTGEVLYSLAGPAPASYTQSANSVITLASAPAATDRLAIFYDDGVIATNAPSSVSISAATTSALTTFTSTTSAQILAASSTRRGVVLSSPSTNTGICYVVLGTTTASSTACSFLVNPGDVINLSGINTALTGIWSAASQTLFVTHLS